LLEEIPGSAQLPVPGLDLTPEEEREALRARSPRPPGWSERLRGRYPSMERRLHAVRRYLGIRAFGCNAWEADAGAMLVPEHDETPYRQEEIFLVVKGRARFVLDGEEVEVPAGGIVYAEPQVVREAFALETPTLLFLVGGVPGEPYAPPAWARDWQPPAP